jgi:hypothetical protein
LADLDLVDLSAFYRGRSVLQRLALSVRTSEVVIIGPLEAAVFPAARERAHRQYDAVEPENRLVACSLERACAEQIEQEYTAWRRERVVSSLTAIGGRY